MPQTNNEGNINLALQAMQNDPTLSARAVGKIFTCSHHKLSSRKLGIQPRRDISANSQKLTNLEELVLVQHILDLSIKGFSPRISVAEDIANRLRATRNTPRVGARWAYNFIKRCPELRTYFQRKYDY
jgi:hypothetical protein